MSIDNIIAARVRDLRKRRGLALDALAELSGVSRSMISLIERGETSPTAAVLNKLADAFGVPLAALLSEAAGEVPASPVARRDEQMMWTDPASGYERRHLSPPGFASPIDLAEVTFPAGRSVSFENAQRNVETHQQVWMLDGEMEITVEDKTWRLQAGDCLAMVLGRQIAFRNPGTQAARYLLALTTSSPSRRQT